LAGLAGRQKSERTRNSGEPFLKLYSVCFQALAD
jgi:hypothetical protein